MAKKNASSTAAVKEMHRVKKEKDAAAMWWDTVANEHNKDCGDWNGACQVSKCCQHGCGCKAKNPFYSQCQGPCGVETARATSKRHAASATGSKDKDTVKDAKAASEAADAAAASARAALAKAKTAYKAAHEAYAEKHKRMVHAQKAAAAAKTARERAHENIGKAEQDAETW